MQQEQEQIEARVLAAVEELGVPYETVWIDPAHAATADFCERYGYEPEQSGNCIVVASRTDPPLHVACVVRATRRLDVNKRVRKLMGVRRVSFAPAEETVRLTGMVPDGVTPFGLPVTAQSVADGDPPAPEPGDLPLWIDAGIADLDRVVVGGGSRRLKLLVQPDALIAAGGRYITDLTT